MAGLGCELAARVLFAFLVGPSVLGYGLAGPQDLRSLPGAVMRVVGAHHSPDPDAEAPGYHKFAPRQKKIDQDRNGEGFSITINRQGFRGADFGPKPPGAIRAVALGASSTFGYHDRDDETWPHYLEERLNGLGRGRRFEVLNLGVPHLTSSEIVALFRAEGLPLDPDVVIFYGGNNDAGIGIETVIEQRGGAPSHLNLTGRVYDWLRDHLLLASFAHSVLYYATVFSPHNEEDLRLLEASNVPRYLANLSELRAECRKRGILLVVATQQAQSKSHYRLGDDAIDRQRIREFTYADEVRLLRAKLQTGGLARRELGFLVHDVMMRELRFWAAAGGVPLADVIRALDHDRDVLLSWVHLDARGNRMVAETLADTILPALPKRRHAVPGGQRGERSG